MRFTREARALLPLLSAGCLCAAVAEAQGYSQRAQSAAPTMSSASLDLAALSRHRIRGTVEATALGRITVGLSVSYTNRQDDTVGTPIWRYPTYGVDDRMSCVESFSGVGCVVPYPYVSQRDRYRDWTFDLALRYYPEFLSFRNRESRMLVYFGGFAGYHWRTWEEQQIYPMYMSLAAPDSILPPYPDTIPPSGPLPPIWPGGLVRRSLRGLQPGVELGARLIPFGGLFVEVGGRFTLVTVDDPSRKARPGDVEPRLVVAAGFAW